MRRHLIVAAWLTLASAFASLLLVGFWLFWPYRVIEFYDSSGGYLHGSYATDGFENVTQTITTTDTYYLKVLGDNAGNDYDFAWTVSP